MAIARIKLTDSARSALSGETALTPTRKFEYKTREADAFVPSPQQQGFFDWVRNGKGNALLEAVAGAGKTTTLVKALRLMNGSVFFGAYNRKIADEIKAKAAKERADRPGIFIGTMHGSGFSDWKRAHKNVVVDDRKVSRIIEAVSKRDPRILDYEGFVAKMVSFGKQFLMGVKTSLDNLAVWHKLAEHFSVDQELGDATDMQLAMEFVLEVYKLSAAQCKLVIDFDDMIFAPIYYSLHLYQNDWVLIDECQDINPARRELARRMLKPGGRLIAVGDSRQAIYGFCHPPGTLIMTPSGHKPIEQLRRGAGVIVSHTDGQLNGWQGGNRVLETHTYHHSGFLLTLHAGTRSVSMTPHHKVPIKLDPATKYYTYMMRNQGVYRVGHCAAYAPSSGEFMPILRAKTERADALWLLGAFEDKASAYEAEKRLLLRVKGTTFSTLDDIAVAQLPTDEVEALKILGEHGRMVDFPFWHDMHEGHRAARNGAIILEACNIQDGMRVAFYAQEQESGGKDGKRQRFDWTPVNVTAKHYSGPVHGITVEPASARKGYRTYPLYFAGDDILVHNTGAGGDSIQKIIEEFNCQRLPLTVTYRCPKAVVEYVHQWVQHIEAHPDAPEGVVRGALPAPEGESRPWFMYDVPTAEDAVLCRYTRPLIQTAFSMIRHGVACKVEGRDIGNGLCKLASRWKVKNLDSLETRLNQYLDREVAKARAAKSESKEQQVTDVVETLKVFIERCRSLGKHTVRELTDEIQALFADDVQGMVTLSTGHKAKGREWPRVYWIQTAIRQRNLKEWEMVQEVNIKYVIGTRAQRELILLSESA